MTTAALLKPYQLQLRKIFPVIIVLISLSLIGTIYVQYSWLRTMLVDKHEEFKYKLIRGINDVGTVLMEQKGSLPSLKNYRTRPDFTWPSEQFKMELMKPPTIAQKFTEQEVAEKLGISQSAVSQLESPDSRPQKRTREKLAALYGCQPEQLVQYR